MSESNVNRIPSISQLMELRPLKDLAHKVSSSTVAAGVKAYLQPYQKMAMEAARTLPYASLQSLASEISDWILGEHGLSRPEVINATGQVLGADFPAGPIAEEILVQAHARRHDYRLASAQENYRLAVEQLLCEMTGAQAALIVSDRQAAVYLLAQALGGAKTMVPRSQMSSTFDQIAVPKLLEEAGVQEVGSSNAIDLDALASEVSGNAEHLLWLDKTNFAASGADVFPSTLEAIGTLKSSGVSLWVALGVAGLLPDAIHEELGLCSAKQALNAGADAVLVGGGFLLGGPGCAIVLGKAECVSQLAELPIADYLQASPASLAELEVTLRIHQSGERVDDRIPVMSLLSTSEENLDLRATRLAEQLSVSPWIAEAITTSAEAFVLPGSIKLPTRHVTLKPTPEGAEMLQAHLQAFPAVACWSQNAEEVVLDLRSLFPRNDAQLVSKLVPENSINEGDCMGNAEK
ncbi:hypothetical protein C5Y96_21630 [Blastopirellula marina]|uniref:L-seryl-tRNA(Sec) selenium transferase n=1 Tax=Blastopirellula marina TaxID=124 RepID=A0A2S8F2B1_9BACT|nr:MULTISPECIES: hypothetical protein [Pirellulaceae]PQO26054.1 hypothetical protein C5Y96_21630 [Blastopirellula marina]RCS44412.1 hypothetical protein DTL36_21675 [Bremerella cremea]